MLWAVSVELAIPCQPKGGLSSREKHVHVQRSYLPKGRDVASLSKFVTVFVDLLQHVSITVDINAIANTTDAGSTAGFSPIKWTLQNAVVSGTYQ
jgi:hypothetical protein